MPFSTIEEILSSAVSEKVFSAAVCAVVFPSGEEVVVPVGRFGFDECSEPVGPDTIFDVASVTKSIPVSSLALKFIGKGRLSLDDRLIDFLPEFGNSERREVTVRHLLAHTLDFGFRLSEQKLKSPEEILAMILSSEFQSPPGGKYFYSNATSILLGLILERLAGESLPSLAEKHFFTPLGMARTGFNPLTRFDASEIVPTEIQEWRGGQSPVRGEIHDESAYVLNKIITPGSAGLFSTAPDLLKFLFMILNGGIWKDSEMISPEIINKITENQVAHLGDSAGLGWELNRPNYMGKFSGSSTFGKTGFTGCVVVGDMAKKAGFVLLTNYVYPRRKPDVSLLNAVRRALADLVFAPE